MVILVMLLACSNARAKYAPHAALLKDDRANTSDGVAGRPRLSSVPIATNPELSYRLCIPVLRDRVIRPVAGRFLFAAACIVAPTVG
jgi:hypothetical protein